MVHSLHPRRTRGEFVQEGLLEGLLKAVYVHSEICMICPWFPTLRHLLTSKQGPLTAPTEEDLCVARLKALSPAQLREFARKLMMEWEMDRLMDILLDKEGFNLNKNRMRNDHTRRRGSQRNILINCTSELSQKRPHVHIYIYICICVVSWLWG